MWLLSSHSVVSDSATPWTASHQASLSFTISQSLFKLMSIGSMMLSNHLILCCRSLWRRGTTPVLGTPQVPTLSFEFEWSPNYPLCFLFLIHDLFSHKQPRWYFWSRNQGTSFSSSPPTRISFKIHAFAWRLCWSAASWWIISKFQPKETYLDPLTCQACLYLNTLAHSRRMHIQIPSW